MNKAGYPQPTTYNMNEFTTQPTDLERWSVAYKNIWRLVEITGTPLGQAKSIILRGWKDTEISRFSSWMSYYENKDDIKYKNVDKLSYLDCDFNMIKQAALKVADNQKLSTEMISRIKEAKTVQTVVDLIYVMKKDKVKTAAEEGPHNKERMMKIFNVVRDVNNEVARKKIVRNLARVLSMDTEGLFPEIPQALSKLIDAYSYSASRIQDVMNRLGLQISMIPSEDDGEEGEKISPEEAKESFLAPKENKEKAKPSSAPTPAIAPLNKPSTKPETPIIPRPENRGV